MKELYKYYLLRRPVSIGAQPDGYDSFINYGDRKEINAGGVEAWGEVLYNRKLSDDEISKYELFADKSEEEKKEAIKDLKNIYKIYTSASYPRFADKDINSFVNQFKGLVQEKMLKLLANNNITYDEYEEKVVNNTFSPVLTKNEMIRFISNRIVEEGLQDCSEFNYIVYKDEYSEYEQDFIDSNLDEICNQIHNDKRVADFQYDEKYESFDMIFWIDYCPHYYDDEIIDEVSETSKYNYLKSYIQYLNDISKVISINNPINIVDTLQSKISKIEAEEDIDIEEEKYYCLKKYIYESGFVDKYLSPNGYEVYLTYDNINELIQGLEEKLSNICTNEEEEETI